MAQRYAPDTNFFLQVRAPRELPWAQITDADTIELVVLDQVLTELDKHKNGPNGRRQRRARKLNETLRPLFQGQREEVEVREADPRVVYRLAPLLSRNRPKPDLLDLSRPDARMVEEALACRDLGLELTLLTDDGLAQRLATATGLPTQHVPDGWHLEPEPDEKDKEIERLRVELKASASRAPVIEVAVLVDDKPVDRIEGVILRYRKLPASFIDAAIDAVERAYPPEPPFFPAELGITTRADEEKYDKERGRWLAEVRLRLGSYPATMTLVQGAFACELVILNSGTASAEQLDVDVLAEGGVELLNGDLLEMAKFRGALPPPPKRESPFSWQGYEPDGQSFQPPQFDGVGVVPSVFSREFYWRYDSRQLSAGAMFGTCGDFRHQGPVERCPVVLGLSHQGKGPVGRLRIRHAAKNLPAPAERFFPVALEIQEQDAEQQAAELLWTSLRVKL